MSADGSLFHRSVGAHPVVNDPVWHRNSHGFSNGLGDADRKGRDDSRGRIGRRHGRLDLYRAGRTCAASDRPMADPPKRAFDDSSLACGSRRSVPSGIFLLGFRGLLANWHPKSGSPSLDLKQISAIRSLPRL
jgi:hypothetical protein